MSGSMNTVLNEVRLRGSELEVDQQSELQVCPKCDGGSSNEESFTMYRRPEGVAYICYRASCGFRGFVPSRGVALQTREIKQPKQTTNPFPADVQDLPWYVQEFLCEKFPCMTVDLLEQEGVKWSDSRQRVLFPMFDVRGYKYGYVARAYSDIRNCDFKRKSIQYLDTRSVPVMHFPLGNTRSDTVVAVEDIPSAQILTDVTGINSVALMGVNLSPEEVAHLRTAGYKNIIIALDNDAVAKGIKIARDLKLDFDKAIPLYLPRDIKDMVITEINKFADAVKRVT